MSDVKSYFQMERFNFDRVKFSIHGDLDGDNLKKDVKMEHKIEEPQKYGDIYISNVDFKLIYTIKKGKSTLFRGEFYTSAKFSYYTSKTNKSKEKMVPDFIFMIKYRGFATMIKLIRTYTYSLSVWSENTGLVLPYINLEEYFGEGGEHENQR